MAWKGVECKLIKEDYIISIVGRQSIEGESEEMELLTVGSYEIKGDTKYISYLEFDNNSPKSKIVSVLKIENDNCVTMTKSGLRQSKLIMEKGVRHQCHYDTEFGSMMIGVFADTVDSNLDENGGQIYLRYSLDINSDLSSMNEITIDIKHSQSTK